MIWNVLYWPLRFGSLVESRWRSTGVVSSQISWSWCGNQLADRLSERRGVRPRAGQQRGRSARAAGLGSIEANARAAASREKALSSEHGPGHPVGRPARLRLNATATACSGPEPPAAARVSTAVVIVQITRRTRSPTARSIRTCRESRRHSRLFEALGQRYPGVGDARRLQTITELLPGSPGACRGSVRASTRLCPA